MITPSTTCARKARRTPAPTRCAKRYPKAIVRDLGVDKRDITEADALIAYLQRLGTQVDFKLYDDKANIR